MFKTLNRYFLAYEGDPAPAPSPAPTPNPAPVPNDRTFTQAEVNAIIAKDKNAAKEANKALLNQLNELREQANLTQQQKDQLDVQINELNSTYKTKQQLSDEAVEKLKKDLTKTTETLSADRDTWKSRYVNQNVINALQSAAIAGEAFNAEQIVGLLQPNTRLVEVKDEKGNVTGFEAKVKFATVDKDKNPVELELTPALAIEKMKEAPEKYGNLFKSTLNSGIGGSNNRVTNPADMNLKDPAAYAAQRAARKKAEGY